MFVENSCLVCASPAISVFFEMPAVPVYCNLLWPAREAALQTPRGDMVLGFCESCGFIYNLAFDPDRLRYTPAYENSLHFSPRFQAYAETLVKYLVTQYDLHNKDIIEIGCGQGDFLTLLCELGGNRGVGFDPSWVNGQNLGQAAQNITFIQDVYSERYADYKADLVCCRQMLEHIPHPQDLLNQVRRANGARENTVVFFEVPNALFILRDLSIWDIIYEHCSYFTPLSLARLFASCGFEVHQVTEAFDGQFLCLEGRPAEPAINFTAALHADLERIARWAAEFPARYRHQVETWKRQFEQIARSGKRAVVWGAGSKGVTFLNTLRLDNPIEYIVDINPRKRGMFVAGTGQEIVSPEFLQYYRPEIVIVMNSIYSGEIRQSLAAMEVGAEVILV